MTRAGEGMGTRAIVEGGALDLASGGATPSARRARIEALQCHLEEFGLNGYQSRVLVALLQLGSATAAQVAQLAAVPRTGVYPVLSELETRGLIEPVPGKSPRWTTSGRAEVMDRLYDAQEDRLRSLAERRAEARRLVAELAPETADLDEPVVHVIRYVAETRRTYEQLLAEAESEVLVFNRPPYSYVPGEPNPAVMAMLARKVAARALSQAVELEDPALTAWRDELEAYHAAGVEGRVVDRVPVKMAIFDRRTALVSISNSRNSQDEPQTVLLIKDPGYAEVHADGFDKRWETARPYVPSTRDTGQSAKSGSAREFA